VIRDLRAVADHLGRTLAAEVGREDEKVTGETLDLARPPVRTDATLGWQRDQRDPAPLVELKQTASRRRLVRC